MPEDDYRLLQAVRVGNIGIFDHDHEAEAIYWSPELRQMYGWEHDEPATLPKILAHVHPEDVERVTAAVRRAHEPSGDGMFDIEHRIIDRRSQVRWLLTRSQTHFQARGGRTIPSRTVGAVQDVSDSRAAAERLRVLDAVLASSAQAVAIADADGKLTFANAALCRLWGYPDPASLVGRSIADLCGGADEVALTPDQVTTPIRTVERPAVRVDGTPFYLSVSAEAVRDADGRPTRTLMTFADVTERKQLETQLLHAQKMESIGRLAGSVAHDFNNMLTVISGGIGLSLSQLPAQHPVRPYLADAAAAARSAAVVTRQLLAFSRKEVITPRVLDLNEVVRRMESMIQRLLGEQIVLETKLGRGLARIRFDLAQLEQIVLNLASNARDAMRGAGKLTIQTSSIAAETVEDGARGQAGGYVLLAVSDDGAGMTEHVRTHLFEPFFTTKDAGKGTGLGLAMVYGAVRQNGGRIEVESELEHGTTFKLYLPSVKQHPPVRYAG